MTKPRIALANWQQKSFGYNSVVVDLKHINSDIDLVQPISNLTCINLMTSTDNLNPLDHLDD